MKTLPIPLLLTPVAVFAAGAPADVEAELRRLTCAG
jgi:hypothetical protein